MKKLTLCSFFFMAFLVSFFLCSLTYGEEYEYDNYHKVTNNLNEIKDADDLAKAMTVKIMHFKDYLKGIDDWYADQADTKAEKLVKSFCDLNPDAPKVFVEVCKKHPDMMEDFIKRTLWDSSNISSTPAFDWAFWECVKIIAERKNGPNWKKYFVYRNLLRTIGSIYALDTIKYAEEKWPQPPRAELNEEGDVYKEDVDSITRHVAMWKEVEDIGNGKKSIEGLKVKLLFYVLPNEEHKLDQPKHLTTEEMEKYPDSFLNRNRKLAEKTASTEKEPDPELLMGIETEPNKNFDRYKSAEAFVSAIMDTTKKNKSRDLDINIPAFFKALAENGGDYKWADLIIDNAIYSDNCSVSYERCRAYITLLDSYDKPLYFILVSFKKHETFDPDILLIKVIYRKGIPWDVITSRVQVCTQSLKKFLTENIYPQLYDSKGDVIYDGSQKKE